MPRRKNMITIDPVEATMALQGYITDPAINVSDLSTKEKEMLYKDVFGESVKIAYSGYGYHGGGRMATGVKRASMNISGRPEQLKKLRELAEEEGMTTSSYVLYKTGVLNMKENNWFVANDNGDVVGHDMSEAKAKALADEMQEKEPDAGWEALSSDED